MRRRLIRLGWLLPALSLVAMSGAAGQGALAANQSPAALATSNCHLQSPGGQVQHVVNLVFDNVHLTRDNPNVPSDLEQMPNLLNFITGNGTMISHEHTPLIAHTTNDIISAVTGLYGDRSGVAIANSFGYYNTNAAASFSSAFGYWTDHLNGSNDKTFLMTTDGGKNTPAPWVPYTRAGCDFGAAGTANVELENTNPDIANVFGAGSPEDLERQQNSTKASADFVGIAIHCGKGEQMCSQATGARPDVLPDEPGGYSGFNALYGAKYTDALISPSGPLQNLDGNVISDGKGNPGFPGFDSMSASNSLAWVAAMQEHGIPVTTAYLSDLHDNHTAGGTFGPGEAGYEAQLKQEDAAFGKFFARLAADGITKDNTVFTVTSDENDHLVGSTPTDPTCDGVTKPCTYAQLGELDGSVSSMLSTVPPYSTGAAAVPAMDSHTDAAVNLYLQGNPARTYPAVRTMDRALQAIQATNLYTGRVDNVTNYLADTVEMKNLHMLTSDPARNATLTDFANPDYFLCAGTFRCNFPSNQLAFDVGFAWNHGDISPDINTTWLGLVGPGVKNEGVNNTVWSDHVDDRPTVLALVGLKDDYRHDGRVLTEVLDQNAARGIGDLATYQQLAQVYEQLNASVGLFGLTTVKASTTALESGTPQNDSTYTSQMAQLQALGQQRDQLALQMSAILDHSVSQAAGSGAGIGGAPALEAQGLNLLQQALLTAGL